MQVYEDRFRVKALPEAVSFFHHNTRVLKQLTPPPIYVQMRRVEPLAEGSRSEFTLWFGPLPVRWLAVHQQVDPRRGFTDVQARGPLKTWVHRHSWQPGEDGTTIMTERVEYEHHPGLRGLFSRLLFARPLLHIMFAYRRWRIQRALASQSSA